MQVCFFISLIALLFVKGNQLAIEETFCTSTYNMSSAIRTAKKIVPAPKMREGAGFIVARSMMKINLLNTSRYWIKSSFGIRSISYAGPHGANKLQTR